MKSRIAGNTISLYVMNIAKMILPMVTLPYLTRVLSKDCYGMVSYVKAMMQYMQLIVDFGFLLSGTKDIVKLRHEENELSRTVSEIFIARVFLAVVAGVALAVITMALPILADHVLYVGLSYIVVFMTCFLFDFYFRGVEKMHIITMRFVAMKVLSTSLTFVFVKSDADMIWIPILDIIGSVLAVVMVFLKLKEDRIRFSLTKMANVFIRIKESGVYFLSEAATTVFSILNTLLIGMFLTNAEVAEWSLCMQLVAAVQAFYNPITNGIYPDMVKNRNISLIYKVLKYFMPIVFAGCLFTIWAADYVIMIIGGMEYLSAAKLLRCLVPVMFFSFPSMLFGWPTLGAIGRVKETTRTTICTAMLQLMGLLVLIVFDRFTVLNIAALRGCTECVLLVLRYREYTKHKGDFVGRQG